MKPRVTARLLLTSPAGRLALMRVPGFGGGTVWVTFGGRLEPGETLEEGAAREGFEETGRRDIALGPAIHVRDVAIVIEGEETALHETFFIARAPDEAISDEGWTEEEKTKIEAVRWWSLEELRATSEIVQPRNLPDLLAQALEHTA